MSSPIEAVAEGVLAIVRKRPGHAYDRRKLASRLKVTDQDLTRAGKTLHEWGYRLKRRKSTFTFVSAPDVLNDTEISYNLKTKTIGKYLACYRSVKSTNDLLAQMAESGAAHGTVVTAEEQTKGRGRLGRVWHSPPGTGIYVSILLRPRFKPERAPALSIMTALALADAISAYIPHEVQIKWPNDVWIGGKKVAGILTELAAERRKIEHVIVGVGINVNQGVGNFPEELRPIATSVRRALKRKVNRVELLQKFLRNFESEYEKYVKAGLKPSQKRVRRYSALIGEPITIRTGSHEVSGLAKDIDTEGRLIVEHNGNTTAITAGEVTVVKR